MQENELKAFIKENPILIYEYINSEILKDIGLMSPDFFVRLINEFFSKQNKRVCTDNLTIDTLGYYLITEILGEAKQAFPFYRKDTLYIFCHGFFSPKEVRFLKTICDLVSEPLKEAILKSGLTIEQERLL